MSRQPFEIVSVEARPAEELPLEEQLDIIRDVIAILRRELPPLLISQPEPATMETPLSEEAGKCWN